MFTNLRKNGAKLMAILTFTGSLCGISSISPALAATVPNPKEDVPLAAESGNQTIVLAGGCFWGVEAVFQHTKGVTNAVSGYAGGEAATAHYDMVGSGTTGHAEAVEVTYDPSKITLGQLLKVFFAVAHNPTELNFQGPDHGTQYRSAIFFASPEQKQLAQSYIAELNAAKIFSGPVVTTLEPLTAFYPAEGYHQDFATLHPEHPYIVRHDLPKVVNLEKAFPELFVK